MKKSWKDQATLSDALSHGLREQEYQTIIKLMNRDVNILELGIFSALFSEHCSYKSSKVYLRNLPTEGPRVVQGPGENAGVIDIGDGQGVVFKIESHNHPSFIEPYQGAATGVGGILRDVFTMGARPVLLLNALRFGEVSNSRTPYLVRRVVAGIGGYGNCMGIPTVGGETFFHSSYNGNCLVNAFALGVVELDKVFYGKAAGIGNRVFYVGSKTGRDGIHGAAMASEEFNSSSEEKRPTVQVGDPFQEKLLLEACLEVMQGDAVIGIQDMGAAGLTSSTFEMADRGNVGVDIHLDRVPQREDGMTPYELMLSESQERMLLIAEKGREEEVLAAFRKWDLDVVDIGEVVEGNAVRLFWHGELAADISAPFVTSAVPEIHWAAEAPADAEARQSFDLDLCDEPEDLNETFVKMLGSVNLCSRRPIFDQYDSTVRTNTVVHPGGDAAVIRVKAARKSGAESKVGAQAAKEKGIAVTLDCNSRYCHIEPRLGTALSLAEACRNLTAVGAAPIGISNCLNFGSPEKPAGMWQFAESVRGLTDAARAFKVPVVSGNVSLYNETMGSPVLPTPQLALVGLMDDVSKAVTSYFKQAGDVVLVIGQTDERDIAASEYLASVFGVEKGRLPVLDYELEVKTSEAILSLIGAGLLASCHDISQGGLAVALAESCFTPSGAVGATIRAEATKIERKDAAIFAETGARYIVSMRAENEAAVRKMVADAGLIVGYAGIVGGEKIKVAGCLEVSAAACHEAWAGGLSELF